MFKYIYPTEDIPKMYKNITEVKIHTIPRIFIAKQCSEYHWLSLMSYLLKIVRWVQQRIHKISKLYIGKTQFDSPETLIDSKKAIIELQKGVQEECVLSTLLFNMLKQDI